MVFPAGNLRTIQFESDVSKLLMVWCHGRDGRAPTIRTRRRAVSCELPPERPEWALQEERGLDGVRLLLPTRCIPKDETVTALLRGPLCLYDGGHGSDMAIPPDAWAAIIQAIVSLGHYVEGVSDSSCAKACAGGLVSRPLVTMGDVMKESGSNLGSSPNGTL